MAKKTTYITIDANTTLKAIHDDKLSPEQIDNSVTDWIDSGVAPNVRGKGGRIENDYGIVDFYLVPQKPKPEQFAIDAQRIKDVDKKEYLLGSPAARYVHNVASGGLGALQAGLHLGESQAPAIKAPREWVDRAIQERNKAIETSRMAGGEEGFDIAGLLGEMTSPEALTAGKLVPKGSLKRMLYGGAVGGGYGLTRPEENFNWFDKYKRTGQNAGLGLFLSGLMETPHLLGKINKYFRAPGTPAGQEDILQRELLHQSGDDVQKIERATRGTGQLVPGAKPTASEAVAPTGNMGIPALLSRASKVDARTVQGLDRIVQRQDDAMVRQVQTIAKNEAWRDIAAENVSKSSRPFYEAAEAAQLPVIPSIVKSHKDPAFNSAIQYAKKISKTGKYRFNPKKEPVRFLQLVKEGIDRQIRDVKKRGGERKRMATLTGMQQDFVSWMDRNIPNYPQARAVFSSTARATDRMQFGAVLEDVLTKPVSEVAEESAIRSTPFFNALRNDGVKAMREASLQFYDDARDLVSSDQWVRMVKVGQNLARREESQRLAQKGLQSSDIALKGKIIEAQMIRDLGRSGIPNALIRPIMIANQLLRSAQRGADEKVLRKLAETGMDVQAFNKELNKAMLGKKERDAMLELFHKFNLRVYGSGAFASLYTINNVEQIGEVSEGRRAPAYQPNFPPGP